ncbi:MAG: DUF4844 domain-containing protein [Verrucomicrobiota bacterium]
MKLTPKIQAEIKALKLEKKFLETEYYPGAVDEETRLRCEGLVNKFLDRCESLLARSTVDHILYKAAKKLQDQFDLEDTEEAERVGDYIGDFMRIVGLDDWTEFV